MRSVRIMDLNLALLSGAHLLRLKKSAEEVRCAKERLGEKDAHKHLLLVDRSMLYHGISW